ncbi:MAG: hypothetical protein KKF65_05655 [Nanoarchaeota archaeon]|nr:hypothetical protein [Nanoarchaeota archaeon]
MKTRVGRKKFDGRKEEIVLQKLEEAFLMGCTDREASLAAGIAPSTLYEYQNKNPEFTERKQALKMNPIFIARRTVVENLDKDFRFALRYLERKLPEEFGLRNRYEFQGPKEAPVITEEDEKIIDDFQKKNEV